MQIVREIDRSSWRDFIHMHPEGNIFQSPEMFDVYACAKNFEPVFIAAVNGNIDILGVLLSALQREYSSALGKLTTRSIIWGGPLVKNNDQNVLKMLLIEYDEIMRKKAILTQFRNLWDYRQSVGIFNDMGYRYLDHLNFVVDLSIGKDELFAKLSSSKRRQIRKSINKEGVKIISTLKENDVEDLYRLLSDYYSCYVKKPLPHLSYYQSLVRILGERGKIVVFLVKQNDEIIGGIFCPVSENSSKKTIYELNICGSKEHNHLYPSVLATWAPIEWGASHGMDYFDFMGAGKPNIEYGVREFKAKFGGQLVSNGRFEKIHQSGKYRLASIGMKVRRFL